MSCLVYKTREGWWRVGNLEAHRGARAHEINERTKPHTSYTSTLKKKKKKKKQDGDVQQDVPVLTLSLALRRVRVVKHPCKGPFCPACTANKRKQTQTWLVEMLPCWHQYHHDSRFFLSFYSGSVFESSWLMDQPLWKQGRVEVRIVGLQSWLSCSDTWWENTWCTR